MARIDKYEPYAGGYRAPMAATWPDSDKGKLYGVGHNSSGQLVKGAGVTGITAVWVMTKIVPAGKIGDPMTAGHVIEFGPTAGVPGVNFGVPGTVYYSDAAGAITSTKADGCVRIGHTVDGSSLIVRVVPIEIDVP